MLKPNVRSTYSPVSWHFKVCIPRKRVPKGGEQVTPYADHKITSTAETEGVTFDQNAEETAPRRCYAIGEIQNMSAAEVCALAVRHAQRQTEVLTHSKYPADIELASPPGNSYLRVSSKVLYPSPNSLKKCVVSQAATARVSSDQARVVTGSSNSAQTAAAFTAERMLNVVGYEVAERALVLCDVFTTRQLHLVFTSTLQAGVCTRPLLLHLLSAIHRLRASLFSAPLAVRVFEMIVKVLYASYISNACTSRNKSTAIFNSHYSISPPPSITFAVALQDVLPALSPHPASVPSPWPPFISSDYRWRCTQSQKSSCVFSAHPTVADLLLDFLAVPSLHRPAHQLAAVAELLLCVSRAHDLRKEPEGLPQPHSAVYDRLTCRSVAQERFLRPGAEFCNMESPDPRPTREGHREAGSSAAMEVGSYSDPIHGSQGAPVQSLLPLQRTENGSVLDCGLNGESGESPLSLLKPKRHNQTLDDMFGCCKLDQLVDSCRCMATLCLDACNVRQLTASACAHLFYGGGILHSLGYCSIRSFLKSISTDSVTLSLLSFPTASSPTYVTRGDFRSKASQARWSDGSAISTQQTTSPSLFNSQAKSLADVTHDTQVGASSEACSPNGSAALFAKASVVRINGDVSNPDTLRYRSTRHSERGGLGGDNCLSSRKLACILHGQFLTDTSSPQLVSAVMNHLLKTRHAFESAEELLRFAYSCVRYDMLLNEAMASYFACEAARLVHGLTKSPTHFLFLLQALSQNPMVARPHQNRVKLPLIKAREVVNSDDRLEVDLSEDAEMELSRMQTGQRKPRHSRQALRILYSQVAPLLPSLDDECLTQAAACLARAVVQPSDSCVCALFHHVHIRISHIPSGAIHHLLPALLELHQLRSHLVSSSSDAGLPGSSRKLPTKRPVEGDSKRPPLSSSYVAPLTGVFDYLTSIVSSIARRVEYHALHLYRPTHSSGPESTLLSAPFSPHPTAPSAKESSSLRSTLYPEHLSFEFHLPSLCELLVSLSLAGYTNAALCSAIADTLKYGTRSLQMSSLPLQQRLDLLHCLANQSVSSWSHPSLFRRNYSLILQALETEHAVCSNSESLVLDSNESEQQATVTRLFDSVTAIHPSGSADADRPTDGCGENTRVETIQREYPFRHILQILDIVRIDKAKQVGSQVYTTGFPNNGIKSVDVGESVNDDHDLSKLRDGIVNTILTTMVTRALLLEAEDEDVQLLAYLLLDLCAPHPLVMTEAKKRGIELSRVTPEEKFPSTS